MIKTNENRKDNVIAWCTTIGTMALLLILLLACSLKTQIPPPPPKQMVYVDIAPMGGGGGGGTPEVASNPKPAAGQNYATQNAQDAPAVNHSDRPSTKPQTQTVPSTPKPDQSSMYRGRGGSGSNGGNGNGNGPGHGDGLGPGTGDGHGGGYGQGTGSRNMTSKPSLEIKEDHGTVCVEVFIEEDGTVSKAVLIPAKSSITDRIIQQACLQKAKQIRYEKGKKERRYVIFGTNN